MCDDNPNVIPDMNRETRTQIQACNMQVVNITTPANYFHALRRQVCALVPLRPGHCVLQREDSP
jgi:2-oxoglutarate dehydrogenase complex dehydrogenase (E1) component-like enzyme